MQDKGHHEKEALFIILLWQNKNIRQLRAKTGLFLVIYTFIVIK